MAYIILYYINLHWLILPNIGLYLQGIKNQDSEIPIKLRLFVPRVWNGCDVCFLLFVFQRIEINTTKTPRSPQKRLKTLLVLLLKHRQNVHQQGRRFPQRTYFVPRSVLWSLSKTQVCDLCVQNSGSKNACVRPRSVSSRLLVRGSIF